MKIRRHPLVENRGHVLLASLMLVIMLSLLAVLSAAAKYAHSTRGPRCRGTAAATSARAGDPGARG